MKTLIYRVLAMVVIGLCLGFTTVVADAYHCAWRHGQWVCWHHNVHHCYWVNGHWYHGVYYRAHRVC